VQIVLKSGNLNLPESSGPVQASTGIALSFASLTNRARETQFQADSYFVIVYENIIGQEEFCQQPPDLQGDICKSEGSQLL